MQVNDLGSKQTQGLVRFAGEGPIMIASNHDFDSMRETPNPAGYSGQLLERSGAEQITRMDENVSVRELA